MTAPGPVARAAELAALAHQAPLTDDECARATVALTDDDDRVRGAALGALVRGGSSPDTLAAWRRALDDGSGSVRRRAAELAPVLGDPTCVEGLVVLLDDHDVTVVEAAAWALGELGDATLADRDAVEVLARVVTDHRDALAREAAVAALGALGDEAGRAAILRATEDRPPVRRRAVLALAAFDGDDVDAALARALTDKDWQVRQAAEDLTHP
ncbi:MAG TPA: HEAT repeat domain-containing protein [Acidimicrobiia bacterium]|nr:HEAT repeat domain-containing protein [Acidimicrobiia bacterium]